MKIALVWKNDYPWDIRVDKMARTLVSFGHEVHIIARNLKKSSTMEQGGKGVIIHRLHPFSNHLANAVLSVPAFLNPRWYFKIRRVCREQSVDLIIVRDLPLVIAGAAVGKVLDIPVIFDMAENYPALWREVRGGSKSGFVSDLLKSPALAKVVEKFSADIVDRIFVVVEEARDHLVARGVDKAKISIVGNTPDFAPDAIHGSIRKGWADRKVLLYQGYVNRGRGLATAVLAMPALRKDFSEALLVIAGDGDDLVHLKQLVREHCLDDCVEFTGWVPHEEILSMMASSTVCLIPHLATEHKNTTIPNKLFDYMAFGRPVVVSDAAPLKRIVDEELCGMSFISGDVESFLAAVKPLLATPSLGQEMGERGRRAVERRYNWKHDADVMRQVVNAVTVPYTRS